jgi:hypothetical protein
MNTGSRLTRRSEMTLTVKFENTSGLNIPVTIEAPINTPVASKTINAEQPEVFNIPGNNFLSVRIIADDPNHGAIQDFVVGPPKKGLQRELTAA